MSNRQNMPTRLSTAKVYTSTMTPWLQMNPLKPSSDPPTQAATKVMAFSVRRGRSLNRSMPSRMRLDPREMSNAVRPAESAAATAEETATRQAMLENGRILVKSQE